jgi:pyruvate, water dikinase
MEQVLNKTLLKLSERAKELECLYKVEEAINNAGGSEMKMLRSLLKIIPAGMQYSTVCEVSISFGDDLFQTEEFRDTPWMISSDLLVDNDLLGRIKVVYTQLIDESDEIQFLPDEQRMLDNIASRVSCWLFLLIIKASENKPGQK